MIMGILAPNKSIKIEPVKPRRRARLVQSGPDSRRTGQAPTGLEADSEF